MKLQATHLIDEKVYLIDNNSRHNLEVAGLKVEARHFTVESLDEIVMVRKPPKQLLHYSDGENILSVEEYNNILVELLENAETDEYCDPIFSNLDEEYAYKKFVKTWNEVYNDPPIEKVPVEVEIVEVRTNSGDPDIVSLWNSPNVRHDNRLYSLNRDKFAKKCCIGYCELYELKYDIPSYNGLKFAKINNTYVFDESYDWSKAPAYVGTLEQCKHEKVNIDLKIKTAILCQVAQKSDVKLNNIGVLLNHLYSIRNQFSKIVPMQKCNSFYRATSTKLDEIIQNLEKELRSIEGGLTK